MKWNKLGLVWAPKSSSGPLKTHAHVPTPFQIDADRIRVYFASLDENKYGRLSFVDVSADDPTKVLYEHGKVCLDIGPLGAFDDCGVVPSCAIALNDQIYLYYIGFQRALRVPYMLFTGLAKSSLSGELFSRRSRVPVLERTDEEPFSRGGPFVMKAGEELRMWYWSCEEWSEDNGLVHYNNVIRSASSRDGISWETDPGVCIRPTNSEFAVGRPWVMRTDFGFRMFFSMRSHSEKYSIGCAESEDGILWRRSDRPCGISRSEEGWDSEMVCYPAIVEAKGRTFMFYNGNGHGVTGFGCAELVE